MEFGFHPDYGLTDDFRTKVVRYAIERGNNSEAARRFGVSEFRVRRWKKRMEKSDARLGRYIGCCRDTGSFALPAAGRSELSGDGPGMAGLV